MAKTKAELIKAAAELGIEVDSKLKVAEIRALIEARASNETAAATEAEVIEEAVEEPKTAKAGKRSEKGLKAVEEKQLKIEQQKHREETAEPAAGSKSKQPVKSARSRLERRGKAYRASAGLIEKSKAYGLEQAVELAQKTSHVKFDATVELHVNLSVDPRQAEQNIRDSLVLPAGTGKTVTIAVLTDDPAAAKKAGASMAGTDDLLQELDKGNLNFDILIATPALMPRLGKYARVLGPRGLMPNPKSGTVTADIDRAVQEAKAGRVEYRVDSTGIVHLGVGKVSFTSAQLTENIQAVFTSIKANKPGNVKGSYLKSAHLATSMGPSVSLDVTALG